MKITYQQVEQNIASIANRSRYTADVLYDLLSAYGRAAAAITQLRQGVLNKVTDREAVLQKDVVYFKTYPAGTELIDKVEELENDPLSERYQPRYLIATDLTNIVAKDTKKETTLAIKIADIDQEVAFFYGWTGDEITDYKTEAVADRRAADKIKELYAEIEKENLPKFAKEGNTFRHELNVFFSRLLFCLFAEDTGLFKKKQFTDTIKTFTNTDGSDLNAFFGNLFKTLDSENKTGISTPFSDFPYVNGTIFDTTRHAIAIPDFNAQARHLILECAKANWSEINPDIFGTIFQSIVDAQKRDEGGMDYTSVPNILKVIEPLFLDELHELFDKYYDDEGRLIKLLSRISKIKIFDPACGSGNFLIISYKELRKLVHAIIGRLNELSATNNNLKVGLSSFIKLENFYGIEIDDFAHEIAILSLFLAAHQMNIEFEKQFGKKLSIIPLIDIPTIFHGNAARLDWQEVCPNIGHILSKAEQGAMFDFGEPEQQKLSLEEKMYDEIYLIGNPPYKGSRKQAAEQKADIFAVCGAMENYKSLDYISIWFLKASDYIRGTSAKYCFVSTNSITQGEQVGLLWPSVLNKLEIGFAYHSFKWQNSARDNAGVTVVIISLRNPSKKPKYLYSNGVRNSVDNINAYLSAGVGTMVRRSSKAISQDLPKIDYGSFALDGGFLTLSEEEKDQIINSGKEAERFIKQFFGSQELIRGNKKYCIWVDDAEVDEAKKIHLINQRIENVQQWRMSRKGKDSQKNASTPWRFAWKNYKEASAILFPIVSSERREYVPIGYLDENTVISNAALAIYDAPIWLFSLLESKMHMAWIRTVCGKLKTDYRYSSTLGYNTFPVPPLSDKQKDRLKHAARKILLARENHSEKTLAEMYDPEKMPSDLRDAHNENDIVVDQLYRKKGFASDADRLTVLFDLYVQLTKSPNRS